MVNVPAFTRLYLVWLGSSSYCPSCAPAPPLPCYSCPAPSTPPPCTTCSSPPQPCTWSAWSWGPCSATCGPATQAGSRVLIAGVSSCPRSSTATRDCRTQPCPVDCTWTQWSRGTYSTYNKKKNMIHIAFYIYKG